MNIFSTNNFLGKFMNWIGNIVLLNVLWIIFSLPIVTIGASTTALYYSTMKWIRRDEGYIHKNFISSFKDNFRQSTIIWIILLIIGLILSIDLRIGLTLSAESGSVISKVMTASSIVLLIPYYFVITYIFPIQAKFENTIKQNLLNSILMATAHFGYTLLLALITASFILAILTSHAFIGLCIFCGAGLYAYVTGNIFIFVFRKHLPDELEEDAEARGE